MPWKRSWSSRISSYPCFGPSSSSLSRYRRSRPCEKIGATSLACQERDVAAGRGGVQAAAAGAEAAAHRPVPPAVAALRVERERGGDVAADRREPPVQVGPRRYADRA